MINILKSKLVEAQKYLLQQQDTESAAKIGQLAAKLIKEEFTIAFCGHFSAGKSTMINRLVGENLLPSSPIPTSANLVKVRAGEDYAKVIFKNEPPRKYLAPYDYKMVKNYCKDGDAIQAIEISHSESTLPDKTIIMDTPGIDSADDAHRIATESAIHLADLIFYVMDYNHVQSELNFMFTKELTEAGKEVYLVINQVDKHSAKELSFEQFKSSVVNSFASWGVTPANIFYTSLKNASHEYNQFPELQAFMQDRLNKKDELLLASIECSLQKVLNDHLAMVHKKGQTALEPAEAVLNELEPDKQAELLADYKAIAEERNVLAGGSKQAEIEFDAELNKILANAYLMPFQTRSLAERYLEACQPKFKVGFLFSGRKTQAERESRYEAFYQEVNEKTKSQVEWHLRDFIGKFLRGKHIETKDLAAKAQSFTLECSQQMINGALKEGASLSGDYVLNYTNDVANEIKLLAKRNAANLKWEIMTAIEAKNKALAQKLAEKSAGLEKYVAALEQINEQEQAEKRESDCISKVMAISKAANNIAADQLFVITEPECEVIAGSAEHAKPKAVVKAEPAAAQAAIQPVVKADAAAKKPVSGDKLKIIAGQLAKTAELTAKLPGFKKLTAELKEKAARLENRGFTVALFGAFSAGKSSFANALIGANVLPVSPNPMTAAINKIKPIDSEHGHGTVTIKLKAEKIMLEDINNALKTFELSADSFEAAIEKIGRLDEAVSRQGAAAKTNYAFLQAFTRGYKLFAGKLGGIITATVEDFGEYVALEEKSCFVELIDLYYDCELTKHGITLVDTPGADSINARHTGVAFEFIKNSDAILFVTYYNHAFSKADREFLIQLGRVKDSFQLDKMFFMINAIDLADNEEEKATVIEYVQEQLIKYGVRNPHLFPLSSLNALKEKLDSTRAKTSGMAALEQAFYSFITHDLADMAAKASEAELKRVYALVGKLIISSQQDTAAKARQKASFEQEQTQISNIINDQLPAPVQERIAQEITELIYYIKQRVFFRFNDFFRESFNPSVLRDDGRNMKQAINQSLTELLGEIGFDFAQEMRATTVRLDRFAERIMLEYQNTLVERIAEVNTDISFAGFEMTGKAEIEFEPAFGTIEMGLFSKAIGKFKNPKSFFENGGNKLMADEINELLNQPADEYLALEKQRLIDTYSQLLAGEFTQLNSQMAEEMQEFYYSIISALDGGVPTAELQAIEAKLSEIIK